MHLSKKILALFIASLTLGSLNAKEAAVLNKAAPDRLPVRVDGKEIVPDLGCFWSFKLNEEDYKRQVDVVAPYGAFDVLTLTLRSYNTLLDNREVHDFTKKAVEYARERYGIGTLLDIDLRIARYDFEKRRPDLAQERLFFQEVSISDKTNVDFKFTSQNLSDHYTGNLPYYVRGGRVVRAWAYDKNNAGEIISSSIVDVTDKANWDKDQYVVKNVPGYEVDDFTKNDLAVSFDVKNTSQYGKFVTCAVAFRYSYPDLFADETLELERKLYEYYSDVPISGICKDEWGFPPSFNRVDNLDDFWYSESMRTAYAKAYDERDLVDDLFLAFKAREDMNDERIAVVDKFRRLCGDRVVKYEFQNYELTKSTWGVDALVGAHCTWYPWPNILEMRKNGLMWWKAPRDFAQTDEYAPFCARNSMAKANDSLWINMFYARQVPPYIWEHWTAAASGGRVHIHQIYPRDENSPKNELDPKLLPIVADGEVAKIRQKIRILNLISNSQIDSAVAVIFGRFAASNPLRPEYKRVGWEICDSFATRGYPADLIPIDEVRSKDNKGNPRWSVKDGYLCYGKQPYKTLIFNGESDAEIADYEMLRKLAEGSKTKIVTLSPDLTSDEQTNIIEKVITNLKEQGVVAQTPWERDDYKFDLEEESSTRPARKCISRFIDGTILWIAAEESELGDPIVLDKEVVTINNGNAAPPISAKANGLFAVKFNEKGTLEAIASAGLTSVHIGDLDINLTDQEIENDPVDVAIWRDADGKLKGVFQRKINDLPEALEKITSDWRYLQRL